VTFILAIDQGTSGTKAIVVDESGAVLSLAEVSLQPSYLEGGGVEQDPEALFASVVTAGRRAISDAGVPIADGTGLGPGHRPGAVSRDRVAGPTRRGRLRGAT
jgi:sugar (pentulose or hexulose) kinase